MKLISIAFTAAALLCASPARAQTAGCTTGGPAGLIPTSGSGGGGAYPTTLPPFETVSVLNVTSVPPGATAVTEIKLFGLTHTYAEDLTFVLTDPAGVSYLLLDRLGGSCDFAGDYIIVANEANQAFPPCVGTTLPPSTFSQFYGFWPTGTANIHTTSLSAAPPQLGNWTLRIYDWAALDTGGLASWDVCFGAPPPMPPPPPQVCTGGGGGGSIPTSGTGGGGAYPGTLPPFELSSTLMIASIPPGASSVGLVKLMGLSHTYSGDLQIVLQDPAGSKYNLFTRVGVGCDFNGDYGIAPSQSNLPFPGCAAGYPSGDFSQQFGTWPDGTNGIFNKSLALVPPQTGAWTLTIYDWAGLDVGSLNAWELCFSVGAPPPTNYCTAKTSSSGCVPAIAFSGTPSPSGNYVVSCSQVEAFQLGVLFWGTNGPAAITFQGGFLCVTPPVIRLPHQPSGGSGPCTGTYSQPMTAVISTLSPGTTLNSQFWFRDPGAASGTGLSNGNQCVVQ